MLQDYILKSTSKWYKVMRNSKDVHVIGISYSESSGLTLISSLKTLLKGICKLFHFAASG